ncbi:MAG: BrnT family toxin [Thermoanaerobaculia bacterium]
MRVEWDEAKNLANQRKHGISFEEAEELFTGDSDFLEIFDEAHSAVEDRFIAIGPIARGIVLIVWTDRDEETVRIVSARWASEREQALYYSYRDRSL